MGVIAKGIPGVSRVVKVTPMSLGYPLSVFNKNLLSPFHRAPRSLVGKSIVETCYAGGRMDFTRGNFKPQSTSLTLQALSCRFFGCNSLIFAFLAFRICLCFVRFKNPPRDFFKQGRARFQQRQARMLLTLQPIGKKPSGIVHK